MTASAPPPNTNPGAYMYPPPNAAQNRMYAHAGHMSQQGYMVQHMGMPRSGMGAPVGISGGAPAASSSSLQKAVARKPKAKIVFTDKDGNEIDLESDSKDEAEEKEKLSSLEAAAKKAKEEAEAKAAKEKAEKDAAEQKAKEEAAAKADRKSVV